MSIKCRFPVTNPLAIAARPKICGADAKVNCRVPTDNEFGDAILIDVKLCLTHAIKLAVLKLTQSLIKPAENLETTH